MHYYSTSLQFTSMAKLQRVFWRAGIAALIASSVVLVAGNVSAAVIQYDSFGDVIPVAGKTKPKLPGGGLGFGGPVAGVTSCVCKDLGMLIQIGGPYGGNYLFSFTSRPKLSVGSYFKSGGFVLGAAEKTGAKCGVFVAGDCKGETADGTITMIGGGR